MPPRFPSLILTALGAYGGDAPRQVMATPAVEGGRIVHALRGARFATALVLLGVALRIWAYAANTSLSLDEILLSRNVLALTTGQLATQPLQLDQVAPRGFL